MRKRSESTCANAVRAHENHNEIGKIIPGEMIRREMHRNRTLMTSKANQQEPTQLPTSMLNQCKFEVAERMRFWIVFWVPKGSQRGPKVSQK